MNGVLMPSQATRPPLVGMPAVWLRDNCPCPLCRDPVSGQRLLHLTDIPADDVQAERSIRINPRSLQPVQLPGPRAAAFYAAYRAFAELLSAPPSMLTMCLRPGDCAVFDNTRVRHARTGFAHGGHRHLQGCYADLDGVESAVAVGDRVTTGVTRRKDQI
jgi:Taurine catabolism dioxygenase TauD, TfdA family/Gamma-butyrobetaine hydroxylase-like, N-terminal